MPDICVDSKQKASFMSKKRFQLKCPLQMAEAMQNKKLDDLTNKIRMIETEHHKLEEESFNKQQELDVLV